MPVPLDNPEESSGLPVAKGAIGRVIEVTKVEDLSNYPGKGTHYKLGEKSAFEPEIAIRLWYQGINKEQNITLLGSFKKNDNNKILGWDKFNNAAQWLLYKMFPGEPVLEDDNVTIIPRYLDRIVNKKIIVVSYIINGTYTASDGTTKHSWRNWNKVFPDGTPLVEIQTAFAAATTYLTKPTAKKPILECYNPSLVDEFKDRLGDGTDFNYGANAEGPNFEPPSAEDII